MLNDKIQWSGDNLWCLLNLEKPVLEVVFPFNKWESISRKKRHYKSLINQGVNVSVERPEWFQEGMSADEIFERIQHVQRPLGETAIKAVIDETERDLLHKELDKIIDQGNTSATAVDGFNVVSGTYEGQTKDAEGNVVVTELHKRSVKISYRKDKNAPAFPQEVEAAEPAIIYPTQEKAPDRAHKLIVAFGDQQIAYRRFDGELHPIHDERAFEVVRMVCADLKPETIVNLGDTVDLPELGRFLPDSNHFLGTMQEAFNRIHRFYAELRADNPEARIVEVDSNHNTRLGKFVVAQAMPLYGVKQAGATQEDYPILTYPHLANLKAVGVEWISGYDAAEFNYNGDLVFKHGKEIRSNGSTAEMLSKKHPYSNLVVGHGHQMQMHSRTTPDGKYLTAVQAGALCKITGEVPGYGSAVDDYGHPVHKYQNWQQGFLIIEDYGDGKYNFLNIPINEGTAYYNGKAYAAEEAS